MAELSVEESRRQELSKKLRELLGSDHVYYQPPESLIMKYPCIRYKRSPDNTVYANNEAYINRRCYQVMVISSDPLEPVVDTIPKNFTYCRMLNQPYVADNLHHTVFLIYW